MSDTPRTDAIVVNGDTARFLKMSRMLERELASMTNRYHLERESNDPLLATIERLKSELAAMTAERDAELFKRNALSTICQQYEKMIEALKAERDAALKECAELRKALEEVVKVLNSNNPAITDTVWVSDGRPETLLDCCLSALGREEP